MGADNGDPGSVSRPGQRGLIGIRMDALRAKVRALLIRMTGRFDSGRADADFSAEIEAHLNLHIEDGVRAGLSAEDARRRALIRLGGVEQVRQAHRERRAFPRLESLWRDLRYAGRTLKRRPGFAITAVLTLGLGIGACTAIFSLINAVIIRSLPYSDPERLVYLFTPNPNLKIPPEVICPSYADFNDIRQQSHTFAGISDFEQAMFSLTTLGAMQRVGGARVDADFFSTLQSSPELGRAIAADDIQPGREKVAVISHSLWVSIFGADAGVLKRSIELDGTNYQVIGVMPPEFEYPSQFGSPLWQLAHQVNPDLGSAGSHTQAEGQPRPWGQRDNCTPAPRCVHSSGSSGDGRHHGSSRQAVSRRNARVGRAYREIHRYLSRFRCDH